jgi:hypothetical protein
MMKSKYGPPDNLKRNEVSVYGDHIDYCVDTLVGRRFADLAP